MKIELSRKEVQEAIHKYVFEKVGDTAYVGDFKAVEDNHYVHVDIIEVELKSN